MYNSNLSLSIFPFKVATFQSLHVANFVKAEGSLCSYTHTHTRSHTFKVETSAAPMKTFPPQSHH